MSTQPPIDPVPEEDLEPTAADPGSVGVGVPPGTPFDPPNAEVVEPLARHPRPSRFFKSRRRRFLVNKPLQYRLLLASLCQVSGALILLGCLMILPLIMQLNKADPQSEHLLDVANSLLFLHQNFWPAAALAFLVLCFFSMRTSHRIAGPLLRFKRVFRKLREGAIPRPSFLRRRDYLHPEMGELNEMLSELATAVNEMNNRSDRVHALVADLSVAVESEPAAVLVKRIGELEACVQELGGESAFFRVE